MIDFPGECCYNQRVNGGESMKQTNDRPYDPKTVWNVPNALTMLRLALIPVFIVLFLNGHEMPALAVFLLATLTDIADGKIARKYNMITNFGKLVDPLADKLMTAALIIVMVIRGIVPLYMAAALIGKELLMVLGGIFLFKKGIVVHSEWIGKLAQVLICAGLILCFFHTYMTAVSWHLIVLGCGIVCAYAALVYYGLHAFKSVKGN